MTYICDGNTHLVYEVLQDEYKYEHRKNYDLVQRKKQCKKIEDKFLQFM